MFDATAPRGIEFRKTTDRGQEINAIRRKAKLDDRSGSLQVGVRDAEACEWSAEGNQRAPDPLFVLRPRIDPDVQILSTARDTVHGHGVGTHDKESRIYGKQRREQVDPVVCHTLRMTCPGISSRR